jgi:hypothetical protein
MPWTAVSQRFSRFSADMLVRANQKTHALTKAASVGDFLLNASPEGLVHQFAQDDHPPRYTDLEAGREMSLAEAKARLGLK